MPDERLFPATMMPDKDWWHALWSDPEAVLRTVGIKTGMDVIDLCCGNGLFTRPLCELVRPGKVWALDLDAVLLAEAEWACGDSPNFQSVLGDARDLPGRIGEPVDFVFIANTLHGVPDKPALVAAVCASLKVGGSFAVINWYRRPREETRVLDQPRGPDTELRMEPEEVRQVVEPAGFELKQIVDVGPYHYGALFVKSAHA